MGDFKLLHRQRLEWLRHQVLKDDAEEARIRERAANAAYPENGPHDFEFAIESRWDKEAQGRRGEL